VFTLIHVKINYSRHLIYKNNHFKYSVQTKGGSLNVSFSRKGDFFTDIWLEGPAKLVFKGEIEI
jgi:diaminopimelate epimerase